MFYDKFLSLCKINGVTPVQVRKDLGISQSTMASWKSRSLTPNAATLSKLADYFGVIMADLLDGNEAKIYNAGFIDGAVVEGAENQIIDELWKDEGYTHSESEVQLINAFSRLNEKGQQKAVDAVEIIAGNPTFKK